MHAILLELSHEFAALAGLSLQSGPNSKGKEGAGPGQTRVGECGERQPAADVAGPVLGGWQPAPDA